MKSNILTPLLLLIIFLIPSAFVANAAEDNRPAKPNVVIILTDDLGWQDLKCYDIDKPSPMETPNLDAFAKKGVMFWQGYSPAPTCAPSRCAIMSGNHPARAQKTHVVGGAPPAPLKKRNRMIDPWYSGRMPANEMTLAKALRQNGYTTGHSGKWHIALGHHSFPQPQDVGFDFSRASRGSRRGMKDRLAEFATTAENDPYRIDENGYSFDQTNEDALTFLRENKDKPFFLYYATWLVHAPIHTRSKARLDKYAKKLGIDPAKPPTKDTPGQLNPFYCSMVEEMDYYIGSVFDYLDETDDPRWPGHKLSENTFVIFTSDNGGMEGSTKERYTDNEPLAEGKKSALEGGTRVPLLIAGPGIRAGVQTDVMANGLDFYPTVLAMTKTPKPSQKNLDGCDLLPLLQNNPQDPQLVKHADGSPRNSMVWHYPHNGALESTIRVGDYKLVRNYDHVNNPETEPLDLFQLYDSSSGKSKRVDIEERKNLAQSMPERTAKMDALLSAALTEMKASYPYYNHACSEQLPNMEKICTVKSHERAGQGVKFTYQENGARVTQADLIYTLNGGEENEEWFRATATLNDNNEVTATLPKGTTHYYLNLVDENRFLRSYPEVERDKGKKSFAGAALSALQNQGSVKPADEAKPGDGKAKTGKGKKGKADRTKDMPAKKKGKDDRNIPFDRWDTNKDDHLSLEEYKNGLKSKSGLEGRFKRFDKNGDGKVSREEFVGGKRVRPTTESVEPDDPGAEKSTKTGDDKTSTPQGSDVRSIDSQYASSPSGKTTANPTPHLSKTNQSKLGKPERPNIVVFVADDMGWGDSGTYGHKLIKTPSLDKLASRGVKLTQCYSACAVCSPSRSAILTGRHPYRNGVWRHLSGKHPAHLRASEITYPKLLKSIGYETCHVGKWHLNSLPQFNNPEFPQPGDHGYDHWMTTHNNAHPSHKNPDNFVRNGKPIGEQHGYSAQIVAGEATRWLREGRDKTKPFALSVWVHEPHSPIATDPKFAELYADHDNRTYMGNISQLDAAVGQVIETLDQEGVADNTLFIFTSDNGPVAKFGGTTGGLRGGKRSEHEGGIRVPGIVSWPGHITPGTTSSIPIVGTDIFTTVLTITGVPLPDDRTIDGVNILPALAGKPVDRPIPLFWRTHVSQPDDRVAMRIGDWKIVGNDTLTKFQLYEIEKDWKEENDLAQSMPEKTEAMKQQLLKLWEQIKTEGPNEWWEAERSKPKGNGKLNY